MPKQPHSATWRCSLAAVPRHNPTRPPHRVRRALGRMHVLTRPARPSPRAFRQPQPSPRPGRHECRQRSAYVAPQCPAANKTPAPLRERWRRARLGRPVRRAASPTTRELAVAWRWRHGLTRHPLCVTSADPTKTDPLALCVLTVPTPARWPKTVRDTWPLAAADGHRLHGAPLLPDDRYRDACAGLEVDRRSFRNGILSPRPRLHRPDSARCAAAAATSRCPGFVELFRAIRSKDRHLIAAFAPSPASNSTFLFAQARSTLGLRRPERSSAPADARTGPCNLATLRPRLAETA